MPHLNESISLGNLITMFTTLCGSVGTLVVWFWKYQRRDDRTQEQVASHEEQIATLQNSQKMIGRLMKKILILQLGDQISNDKLQEILELEI